MTPRDEKYLQMTTTPVEKLVSGFAVPSILTMMVGSIYNLVDTFFVGQLDTQSTAALGVVFSYMGIIQAVAFFFGHGSGNFISRALGSRQDRDAETMAANGFFLALLVTAVVAVLCACFMTPVLRAFGATPTVLGPASRYFRYILLGTPFMVGSFVLNNQMRLQGNAAVAVRGIMTGAILNILLDPLFIFVLKMGVAGAGLATCLAQAVGFFLLLHLSGRNGGIAIRLAHFHPSWSAFREISAGGLPSLTRQSLMCLATICLNNCAGVYGDAALAAFSVVGRVMHLATTCVLGFGQGFQPVCGYNYGAQLYDRVRRAFRFCIMVGTAYCIVAAVLGELFAPSIVRVFRADDPEVIRIGAMVLRAQCLTYPLTCFVTLTNMYLQNTRQTLPAVIVAAARQGIFLIPALLVGASVAGLQGVVIAQPISDVCAFLLCLPLCIHAMRHMESRS